MPRKSTASAATSAPTSPTTAQAPGDTSMISNATEPKSPTTKSSKKKDDDIGIDDLLLPRTLTSRLARGTLPANTSLQKDAVLALTKSATVFISYLASTANELTSKKTISPQAVLKALEEMELGNIMELGRVGEDGRAGGGRLERELALFEEGVRGKRKGYREKVKARESVGGSGEGGEDGDRGEPERKRVRMEGEDEESLLDKQLNGGGEEVSAMDGVNGGDATEISMANGDRGEGDETEDDPELEEQDQDEDVGDDDDEEDDEEEQEQEPGDEEKIEIDDSRPRSRLVLAPDGRAEIGGSEDESD